MIELRIPTAIIILAAAIHATFRLAYLFYIGRTLRTAQHSQGPDSSAGFGRWIVFKRRAFIVFAGDVASTAVLLLLTVDTLPDYIPLEYTLITGLIFTVVGLATKIAACWAIGTAGFYCYNFFCSDGERKYVAKGIYKYLDNPMYGLGYLHAVGFPLLFRSSWGLAFAAFDWIVIWIFYFVYERQHTASSWNKLVIDFGLSGGASDTQSSGTQMQDQTN